MMEEKSALIINGSGTSGGGTFSKVRINGSGKIIGDIECESFSINGSGSVQGTMKTDSAHINGSGQITGSMQAETFIISGSGHLESGMRGGTLRINGSARVNGPVEAQTVKIEGTGKIGGNCAVEEMHIDGVAEIGGNCECERFRSHGAFIIEGLLNADDIQIDLYHARSRAKEIGGGHIDVRMALVGAITRLICSLFVGKGGALLDAGTIEGDDIYLEQTHADVVRGRDVTLGKGCSIGLVEYSGTLTKLEGAEVREEQHV